MTTVRRQFAAFVRHFSGLLGLAAFLGGCQRGTDSTEASHTPDTPGMAAVVTGAPPNPATLLARVEVTSAGFQPSRVDVGRDRSVVFRRTTDKACATSVVFPALGLEKPLPLNTDVAIELPTGTKGELAFQCGMGMDRGKVIVR